MSESLADLLRRAAALERDGRRMTACLLVKARGSTPQTAGALMLVDDSANTYGTIGGGCVEAEVRRRAFSLLGESRGGLMNFKLDHDYGWDDGLLCGGTIELAVGTLPQADALQKIIEDLDKRRPTTLDIRIESETDTVLYTLHVPPRDRLLIAGAGHVGQALARLAIGLDFEVTLFDDRHDLLERFAPSGATTVSGEIADRLRAESIDNRTYVVIVTRGHRHDEQALEAVIDRGAAYVGMIGSRRKVKLIFDDLTERGTSPESLAKVHAPIGLDIGAVTVSEIALSIAAQLVEVRRAEHAPAVTGPVSADALAAPSRVTRP